MNAIDAELFGACFTQWVASLGGTTPGPETGPEVVAIDGKTSRRTHDRDPLHLVSAWASGQRLVLGQQACAAKSNEITAIPLLLDRLAIRGALVTIDAMGCQTKIAQTILDRQADYLLAVKDNWPNLHAEIARAFDDPQTKGRLVLETTDGDHGRIEQRRHAANHAVAFLQTDRRFPGEPRFPGLRAIAMVQTTVERNGKTSRERRFSISSLPLDAELFARAVREHWHVENRLHWVLDVVFHDDLSRHRSGHGPQNMATARHISLNLLRGAKDKHSLKVRRKSAAWDDTYLEAVIRQTA